MPSVCVVKYCGKSTAKGDTVQMFRFPKNTIQRMQWINFTQRTDAFVVDNARICSDHFCENDFSETVFANFTRKTLKANVVPSIYPASVHGPSQSRTGSSSGAFSMELQADIAAIPAEGLESNSQ